MNTKYSIIAEPNSYIDVSYNYRIAIVNKLIHQV